MLVERARRYLATALAGTPAVVARLLRGAGPDDYDRRPDPERFTLREVIAHLADWEGVWWERLEAVRTRHRPVLPGYDEGQWAIDHDYAHADVERQLACFAERRRRLVALLESLGPQDWERVGLHTEVGEITLEGLAVLVLGHDGYHTRQIAEWLQPAG